VEAGRFRKDLYYRLRGVELTLPPLRSRTSDIAWLARHFLERHASELERPVATLSSDALELLSSHDWPGNVRELEATLLRALLQSSGPETLRGADLRPFLAEKTTTTPSSPRLFDRRLLETRDLGELKEELEREYLTDIFVKLRGNPRKLMTRLGVKRTQLYAWFRRLGIDVRDLRKKL